MEKKKLILILTVILVSAVGGIFAFGRGSVIDIRENRILRVDLSEKQQNWLDEHRVISIGVEENAPPYEYIDDGELKGFTLSYLRLLEKSLGVRFEFVPINGWQEAETYLKQGKIMALSFAAKNNDMSLDWLISKPYVSSSLGIFGAKGTLINNLDEVSIQKIAIGKNTIQHWIIAKDKKHNFVIYDDVLEAMKAVNSGEIEFYIGDILHSKFVIDKLEMKNLYYVAPVVGSAYNFGLAVKPENDVLLSMINEVFDEIDAEMHLLIRTQWQDAEYLRSEFMINHYGRYIFWMFVGFMLILVGVIYRSKKVQKQAQQMSHLQKMESLGRLAGGVAHDFNNMLAGIQGAAEFMKMRDKGEGGSGKYVDMIIKTCQRAAYLTSQLLVFSREKEKDYSRIDVAEVVRDAISLLEHGVPKTIEIETDIGDGFFCIHGNKNYLQSLMLNLGFNAKDAINGVGKIRIGLAEKELWEDDICNCFIKVKPGKYIELSISDTGSGIAPEIIDKIFEPFFTTKEEGKGTGLGLAAVYGIIQDHKGTVCVESSSVGTVFLIYFPQLDEGACPIEKEEIVGELKGNILVLDDEKILLELLKDILGSLGCCVTAYSSAQDLLDNYSVDFDVVMLDVVMPKISGTEVYHQLKKLNPALKTIFMSGYSSDNEVEEILNEDKNTAFVKKPYGIGELRGKLAKLLQES